MTSFSSPKRTSSASLPSTSFSFSRSASVWRSASGMARPPYGWGTWIDSRSSGCWSKKRGLVRRKMATSSGLIGCARFSYLDLSFEDALRRAFHPHRIVAARPTDGQRAAARLNANRRIDHAAENPGDRRRAGAGAAGERLAGAALPDAKHDLVTVAHFHVARVHPLREARVVLEQRALRAHRRRLGARHDLHGMRIAHGEDRGVDLVPAHAQALDERLAVARGPHVDAHLAVVLQAGGDRSRQRLDEDLALVGEPLGVHELDEAARAVSALLDFAAVGVEDAVAEVGLAPARALDDEQLVAADAEMPVGHARDLLRAETEGLARRIDDDEVVARALHLGEAHRGSQ